MTKEPAWKDFENSARNYATTYCDGFSFKGVTDETKVEPYAKALHREHKRIKWINRTQVAGYLVAAALLVGGGCSGRRSPGLDSQDGPGAR